MSRKPNYMVIKTLSSMKSVYECYITTNGLLKGVVAGRLQLRPMGPIYLDRNAQPLEFNVYYLHGYITNSGGYTRRLSRQLENTCDHLKYKGEAVARRLDENLSLVKNGTESKYGISTGNEPVVDGRIFASQGNSQYTKKYYGPSGRTEGSFVVGPYSSTTGNYQPEGALKEDTRKILTIHGMSGTYESRNLFWTAREGTTGQVTKVYQSISYENIAISPAGLISAEVVLTTRTIKDYGSRTPNDVFPSTYRVSDTTEIKRSPAVVLVRRFDDGFSTYSYLAVAHACRFIGVTLSLSHPKLDSELAGEAMESQIGSLSSNNIENAIQLRDGPFPMEALRKASRDLPGALASLYLWYRYVYKTSIRDFSEILKLSELRIKQARAFSGKWIRARSADTLTTNIPSLGDVKWRRHFRIFFRSAFEGGTPLLKLRALGLHPGLAQGYDLIPYSFVADWFLSIQKPLKAIDDQVAYSSLRLGRGVYSSKCEEPLSKFAQFAKVARGDAIVGYYHRTPHSYLPLTFGFKGVPARQWWQAGLALCISNRKA